MGSMVNSTSLHGRQLLQFALKFSLVLFELLNAHIDSFNLFFLSLAFRFTKSFFGNNDYACRTEEVEG